MDGKNDIDRKSETENITEVIYKPPTHETDKQERLIAVDKNGKKDSLFLYFSTLTADLVTFTSACSIAWSSPAFQKLKSSDLEVNPLGAPLTPLQESWIAALLYLGATVGPLLSGKFADIYGRKKALMLLATLEVISYIILAFATNIYLYYLTRFLLGICVGMCCTVLPVYIGEICEDHNRGKFVCIMGIFIALGALYTLSIAPLVSLKMFTLTCTIPLIFALVNFTLILPETPVYLASTVDKENAIKVLMKLRNKDRRCAEKDLLEMIQMTDQSSSSNNSNFVEIFKTPAFRKGLIICMGVFFFQQFSGYNGIMSFIGPIFDLSESNISSNISTSLVAIVQVIAVLVASVVVEKLGRKFLLLISIIVFSICLVMLGLYFYLKDNEFYYIQSISWLPVTSLMVGNFFFFLGLMTVPYTLITEIFPLSIRSTASSIIAIFGSLTSFFVTFVFSLLVEYIGMASCCWLFGGFCALGAIFIYTIVPETKGKAIVEVQKLINK